MKFLIGYFTGVFMCAFVRFWKMKLNGKNWTEKVLWYLLAVCIATAISILTNLIKE